jgi:hypothetical protein
MYHDEKRAGLGDLQGRPNTACVAGHVCNVGYQEAVGEALRGLHPNAVSALNGGGQSGGRVSAQVYLPVDDLDETLGGGVGLAEVVDEATGWVPGSRVIRGLTTISVTARGRGRECSAYSSELETASEVVSGILSAQRESSRAGQHSQQRGGAKLGENRHVEVSVIDSVCS